MRTAGGVTGCELVPELVAINAEGR